MVYSAHMAEAVGGTHSFGPRSGQLLVKTGRTGPGSRAGHDLTIEATRWRGTATIDTADPDGSAVALDAEVDSLQVREGTGGVKTLTDSDRAEIKRNLRKKLDATTHPVITFRSTSVKGSPDSFTIEGDLTVVGFTRPITVRGSVAGGRARGSAAVVQSEWGIQPYSAFFGALKLADEVTVEFDVSLTPIESEAGGR